jgi:2-C-methyl-D-erythritol 4-phosphate cytidylyltransferase
MLKHYCIIVAGGSGSRMNSDIPKQFIELNGKPVLMHTIDKFVAAMPSIQIIVVLANVYKAQWMQLCEKHNFSIPFQLTEGGVTRFHSVKNGLTLVPNDSIVGIHDAARPLVSVTTIHATFEAAQRLGNASPAITISESMREINGDDNKSVNRSNYVLVQTPQCFQSTLIKKAFLQNYTPSFTDDASVLEATGEKINLVEGNRENIKITTPYDLVVAEAMML